MPIPLISSVKQTLASNEALSKAAYKFSPSVNLTADKQTLFYCQSFEFETSNQIHITKVN